MGYRKQAHAAQAQMKEETEVLLLLLFGEMNETTLKNMKKNNRSDSVWQYSPDSPALCLSCLSYEQKFYLIDQEMAAKYVFFHGDNQLVLS